jgi:uncharacterized protein (DUF2062 family)
MRVVARRRRPDTPSRRRSAGSIFVCLAHRTGGRALARHGPSPMTYSHQPQPRVAAIIPTYNNRATVADVIAGVRRYMPAVIVVDDGSTDGASEVLAQIDGIDIVTVRPNRGKGNALRSGFVRAAERGFTHALTIDADGQHLADDIPRLLASLALSPDTLWIGNRVIPAGGVEQPRRSRFGARFGSFWYRFHTGLRIDDTQCGLRIYPLGPVLALGCRGNRFEYEIEVLIRAAWAKMPVAQVDVQRYYQPTGERVSHFRPVRDFLRISKVNSKAALTRIFLPWRFMDGPPDASAFEKLRLMVVRELSMIHSPRRAAAALALGAALGVSPFHGLQVLMAIGLSVWLRLNRPLAVLGVGISSPPLLPFWLVGQYAVGTYVLSTDLIDAAASACAHVHLQSLADLLEQTPADYFLQWLAGSVVTTPVVGAIVFAAAYPFFVWYDRARVARG